MARTIAHWIGNGDDAKIPPRVMLRVFLAFDGRCACCNRKIMTGEAWQMDHKIALANGGTNSESNLQPMLTEHHKNKTRTDVAEKSRTYARRKSHYGLRKAKHPIKGWQKFDGTPVRNPKLRRAP